MNMADYLKTLDSDGIARFAEAVGTKPVYLRQISYGFRRPSMRLALHIEKVTNGQLTARNLRPDLPWTETAG
jgi:DNA-binding transcriptional regulator YdaS (Cro superfamily)